ncbi:MAG: tRNA-dihydrouridine synthase family protein [Clostridia bacterium]|nr:tRNA-dihydrouridine synthase family protein [Clostridia bacterium]
MSKVEFSHLALAPMAGYTDRGHRALCVYYGCGQTVTEMVSLKALLYKNTKTYDLLCRYPVEKKTAVQLFGNSAEDFLRVGEIGSLAGFDVIDINMGCPTRKIVSNGEGSALMQNMPEASKIIQNCSKHRTVTVKFRKGVDELHDNCVEFAKMCEDSGASAITVHCRFASDMYAGKATWDTIGEVVNAVKIPVYANGDITSANAEYVLNTYKPYGIAVGRCSLGNPQLFAHLKKLFPQTANADSSCQPPSICNRPSSLCHEQPSLSHEAPSSCCEVPSLCHQPSSSCDEVPSSCHEVPSLCQIAHNSCQNDEGGIDRYAFSGDCGEIERRIRITDEFSAFLYGGITVNPERDALFQLSSLLHLGDVVAVNEMRKHLAYYFAGQRGAREYTARANRAKSVIEIIEIIDSFYNSDRVKFCVEG